MMKKDLAKVLFRRLMQRSQQLEYHGLARQIEETTGWANKNWTIFKSV